MNPVLWKRAIWVLLVLVVATFGLLRVESVSVWLRAPNPQTDAAAAAAVGGGVVTANTAAAYVDSSTC
jgi:hypothetical protein